jgi:hypothetical protein
MPKMIHDIAREAAQAIVTMAQSADYDVRDSHAASFQSDVGELVDAIAEWLETHMEPQS